MIIEANKENMNKILNVLDNNLVQALADLMATIHFVEEEANKSGIKYNGKIIVDEECER